MEINLKWRAMIMKAVGILRRETVRASRMDLMHWEDGFDPEKDTISSAASSYQGKNKKQWIRRLVHTRATCTWDNAWGP